VRVRLALEAVVKAEGIEVTEEDLEAEYTKMSELYKMDVEQIKNFVPAADLSRDIAVDKALQVIKDAAVITEE